MLVHARYERDGYGRYSEKRKEITSLCIMSDLQSRVCFFMIRCLCMESCGSATPVLYHSIDVSETAKCQE